MNFTELSCTTGLLLVAVLRGGNLGDGLAVRNLRGVELDVELEFVLESPLHEIDMLLALTAEYGLAEFL